MSKKVNLREKGLPKWPQMLVSGKRVTIDQAKDIIFKTDTFFINESTVGGGNNQNFNDYYREIAGLNDFRKYFRYAGNQGQVLVDWHRLSFSKDLLRDHLQVLDLSYLNTDWGSSNYVGGPHGWCHPTGEISFSDNIGKWPDTSEVEIEFIKIAKAFPYLELVATLMDGEDGEENSPVVNFFIKNGEVQLKKGSIRSHNKYKIQRRPKRSIEENIRLAADTKSEQGLPNSWYEEYAHRVKTMIGYLDLLGKSDSIELKSKIDVDQYVLTGTDILHRNDGPALIFKNGTTAWYQNGIKHREDGPAIEWSSGNQTWYHHGKKHRLDGPAHIDISGSELNEYWLDGKQYTQDDHKLFSFTFYKQKAND